MRNFEKYEKEIKEMGTIYFGVDNKSGKPTSCNIMTCEKCQFNDSRCSDMRVNWLYDEYMEHQVDWSKIKMDTPIYVRRTEHADWEKRRFAKYESGLVYAWIDGRDSWTAINKDLDVSVWAYARLAEEE